MIFGLLLAAGSSTRFGGANKLLASLPSGDTVLRSSYRAFAEHPRVDSVGLVGSAQILDHLSGMDLLFAVEGGSSRPESCRVGLELAPQGSLVLVHDAARPFVSRQLIDKIIEAAETHKAAIPATPLTDTIKRVENGKVASTLDRARLFRAQTPQAAYREQLIEAYQAATDATDEASALEAAGVPVYVVPGEETNVKITTVDDLPTGNLTPAVGYGFDIHAFSEDPSRRLLLGGVCFDGERGLEGHSDADVVLHALTDALLGAVGGGDIGQLFPNTDPAYAGADSLLFLRKAIEIVAENGGKISSADITLLAETPKLGDNREKIRQIISQELCIPQRRVNIKATTMEGLGAIGRNEGIAAMAAVTILLQ